MKNRLSGRLTACLHVTVLALISVVFAKKGAFWLPIALYLLGAIMLWMTSLHGAKRRMLGDERLSSPLARGIARHGMSHGGHARRRDWDRSGSNTRILLHFLCLVATGLGLLVASGAPLWLGLLAGVAFSLGVESGYAAFSTGDEAILRRHRRPIVAPDNDG